MTRLIDANALKEEFPKDEDWEYPVNTNQLVCETIDAQPTIDAIPISFIEEHVKLCNKIGFIRGEECYIALIENWREKNGTETD